MPHPQSQVYKLLFVVAVLAVVGGLGIVIVTSPQSWRLGPVAWFQSQVSSPTPVAPTDTPPPTASATLEPPTPTGTPTTEPTPRPSRTPTGTPEVPTETARPPATPTATQIVLPQNAAALARVDLDGAANGRVRNAPNGDTVIAVLPEGTEVYMLFNQVTIDGIVWVEVETVDGTVSGWMADFLLEIVFQR